MMQSAFNDNGHWFKGNYHSHTTLSDGSLTPEEQIGLYRSHGYDFLAITDHNLMTSRRSWGDKNFLLLPAWERDISYVDKVKCIHVIGLFSDETEEECSFRREKGDRNTMTDQQLLDQMRGEDRNVFISIAHPTWSRMEISELLELKNFDAIEVFNTGTECLCHEGHAEYVWDTLLRHGRHTLAVACDDTHGHTKQDDHFGGWIMVNAPSLSRHDILENIRGGNYYSTMGPRIIDWGLDGDEVYIKCSEADEVHFITWPARGKANFDRNTTEMRYTLKGGEKYVRVEIIDSEGKRAWTNPIYF